MKLKKRMSKEEGVSEENEISQCESPYSEHEKPNVIKNASFSKVTVRRKPDKTLLTIFEEKDSDDSVNSMPINQSYNCKKKKKKKKEKSSDNDNGLLSEGNDDVFKPKKTKKSRKIKSITKNLFNNVELDNDIPGCSPKKKKKRDKLTGQDEFTNQTDCVEHCIAEVVSTSLTKSPKNYKSQLEENDLQCVVHETEITHSPSEVNILESKYNSDNEEKSQTKHRNNKRKNGSINEDECVIGNILLPTKSPRKKRKQQKHLKDSDNTIQTSYCEQNNTNAVLPTAALLTKSPPSLKVSYGESNLKVDQEIDASSSAQVNLQLLQQTFNANNVNFSDKKNRKKKIINCELDEEIKNLKTSRPKKIKKIKKSINNSTYVHSKDDNDGNTEADLSDALQNISSPKIKVENQCIDFKTVSPEAEKSLTSFKVKTKSPKQTYVDDNRKKKRRKSKIKSTYSEEPNVINPNELITNSSIKLKKHLKHVENSENVIQKTVDNVKLKLLKETSDAEDTSFNKPERKKKKKDVIADLRSPIELTTSSKQNKKEKSPSQLKGDTTEITSTDDLLGSDSSVFKLEYKSINLMPRINSTGANHKEVSKRKKKIKQAINDTDIITARLLKNALKESGTTQNNLQQKNKKLKTEKKNCLLSSSNQKTLQDFSKIIPSKQKIKIDLKRKHKKIKKQMSNEIEKIQQDLLSAALKRLNTNSFAKSNPANLKTSEESDKSPKLNLPQTLHVSKSLKETGNKPKVVKIDESVKKYSKLKKTKAKDPLEELTSKMLAKALSTKQN